MTEKTPTGSVLPVRDPFAVINWRILSLAVIIKHEVEEGNYQVAYQRQQALSEAVEELYGLIAQAENETEEAGRRDRQHFDGFQDKPPAGEQPI